MHRAYQPITPANNLYLKHNWDKNVYMDHRRKVLAAKAVIDNHPPKTYMHLHIKPKKLQMEGERLAIVEKDNRILLEKMAYTMRTGGQVDNIKKDYCKKSLNKTKRYRELLRITYENLAILKRINAKEPHYNHTRWAIEWQFNRIYYRNISKYPYKLKPLLQPEKGFKIEEHSNLKCKIPSDTSHSSYLESQLPKEANNLTDKSPERSPRKPGKAPQETETPPKEKNQGDNAEATSDEQNENSDDKPEVEKP